ncbi:MAG TPA: hypothetical protein VIM64_09600 [Puia sp.]
MAKKLLLLLLMAAPYFVAIQGRAGDKDKDKDKDKPKHSPTAPTGNGVPLDGGVVFLMVAGLGLGAKLLYDARAKKKAAGGL